MIRVLSWVSWNTFLAVIPVVLAYAIYLIYERSKGRPSPAAKTTMLVLGAAWLVFMPNTCYLLTEWRHFLQAVGRSMLWAMWKVDSGAALDLMMYTLFYAAFSGIGIITFALAIRPVAHVMRKKFSNLWIWGIPFFFLMSVGVYLGLVLRFNTWDLVVRPGEVWAVSAGLLSRPVLMSFILSFAAFLWGLYWMVDIWIDGLAWRLRGRPR